MPHMLVPFGASRRWRWLRLRFGGFSFLVLRAFVGGVAFGGFTGGLRPAAHVRVGLVSVSGPDATGLALRCSCIFVGVGAFEFGFCAGNLC